MSFAARISTIALVSVLLAACSKSPGEWDIKMTLMEHHKLYGIGFVLDPVVESATWENGKYKARVSYRLLFKKDIEQVVAILLTQEGMDAEADDEKTARRRKELMATYGIPYGGFKRCQVLRVTEEVVMVKGEKNAPNKNRLMKEDWKIIETEIAPTGIHAAPPDQACLDEKRDGAQERSAP